MLLRTVRPALDAADSEQEQAVHERADAEAVIAADAYRHGGSVRR
ncbi:hypothetical protein [Pseudonocardia abyssalis]|nr:hypothetical protein [Pseudonocardia abyssalis]